VADGSSDAEDMIGMEFEVVGDDVPVHFGTNEEISPDVVAYAGAGMEQEVSAVDVSAAAAGREAATAGGVVEQQSLGADSGHEVARSLLSEMGGGVHRIQVIQDGTIGLQAVVETLMVAKGTFGSEAEMLLIGVLNEDTGIVPALLRRRQIADRSSGVFERPEGVASGAKIKLLRVNEAGEHNERADQYKPMELSQYRPLGIQYSVLGTQYSVKLALSSENSSVNHCARTTYIRGSANSGLAAWGDALSWGCNRNLVWTDSVSDGGSDADDVVRAEEISVVEDVIVVNFWADESMAPHVIADTGSHINQEVVGAVIAGTEGIAAIGRLETVETGGLPTDSAKQVGAHLLVETRLVHSIDVKKDGAISLAETAEVSD
jgi:hypothetical protein